MASKSSNLQELLARNIRKIRIQNGWTQDYLAREAREHGLSLWRRSVIASIENGSRRVQLEELIVLSKVFGKPLEELMDAGKGVVRVLPTVEVRGSVLKQLFQGINPAVFDKQSEWRELSSTSSLDRLRADLSLAHSQTQWKRFERWLLETVEQAEEGSSVHLSSQSPSRLTSWPKPDWVSGSGNSDDEVPSEAIAQLDIEAWGELELNIGRKLKIHPRLVAVIAHSIWGHSASEERDRRSIEYPQAKQHVSREIAREISSAMSGHDLPEADYETSLTDGSFRMPASQGVYRQLYVHLQEVDGAEEELDFNSIERILSRKLPASARRHRAWWANDVRHSHARSWQDAGWLVESVDLEGERVIFRKK